MILCLYEACLSVFEEENHDLLLGKGWRMRRNSQAYVWGMFSKAVALEEKREHVFHAHDKTVIIFITNDREDRR